MTSSLFFSFIAALAWGIMIILDKWILFYLTSKSYIVLKTLFIAFIGIIIFITYRKKLLINLNKFNNNKKNRIIFISFFSALLLIIANFFFFKALSIKNELVNAVVISYILPIIISSLIGFYAFNHKINTKMIFGLIITFFGIYYTITNNPNNF